MVNIAHEIECSKGGRASLKISLWIFLAMNQPAGRESVRVTERDVYRGHPIVETGMQLLSKFILSLDFRLSINLIENCLHDKSRSAYADRVRIKL